ncbi:MAG: peptidoglycan D,D-transpeptidase FtsI family protein, partial [Verrucomicrobiales bacterium]
MDKSLQIRSYAVCVLLVSGLTALSYRLVDLQAGDPQAGQRVKVPDYEFKEILPANRGLILDRNETPLAQNRPEATLVADKVHLQHRDNTLWAVAHRRLAEDPHWAAWDEEERREALKAKWRELSKALSPQEIYEEHLAYGVEIVARALRMDREKLERKIRGPGMEFVLRKDIREDDARQLELELDRCHVQGFRFKRYNSRTYSAGTLAPHLVGFVDAAGLGQMGVERSMEEYLEGRDGYRVRKKNKDGLLISSENAQILPPTPGLHVKLSLDAGVQGIAEEELDAALETYQAEKGTIIVMDPYTGDVLAMANRPHFDLNLRENAQDAWTNFAVQGTYEPGSIFKIVALGAALDSGVAGPESVVDCGWGQIKREGYRVPDHHNYGELSLAQVMAKSSNTGTFLFAERVGKRRFYEYLDAFGFGRKTGI